MLSWKAPTTSSASSETAHGSTATSSPHYSAGSSAISVEPQAGNTKAISVDRYGNPSWVVFGIKDMDEYDEIENIESSNLLNDPSFFKELKKRHAKHRWFFQRWLSPFRFRYCKFVQVNTPFTSGKLYLMNMATPVTMSTVLDPQGRKTRLLTESGSLSVFKHVMMIAI
ncbi:unnamed protein product [Aspergillus oryzae]|nr:unnamed protein product [Aspergillus oryzae]